MGKTLSSGNDAQDESNQDLPGNAAQIVIGWPLVFAFLKVREQAGPSVAGAIVLRGAIVAEAVVFESVLATHHRLRIDFDRNRRPHRQLAGHAGRSGLALNQASYDLSLLGFAIIAGRLTIGWLVDWLSARIVAPIYILLPFVRYPPLFTRKP